MLKVVDTNYGKVEGVRKQFYTVFRGIPYAKPPAGELRWRSPQPPDQWEGIYPAKQFGNRCLQVHAVNPDSFYDKEFYLDDDFWPELSEDSLYLNIWTPAQTADENLPVAFWIHGGAFSGGYGSELEFDGEAYCRQGVILVTINYRLGLLGFLAHPALSAESPNGVSGNYGILDQIAALKWVCENIAYFGGDPHKITIFGQSAGAMSVQTLVSSPLAKGMIAGAILQSAAGFHGSLSCDVTMKEMEAQGEELLQFAGVSSIEELRKLNQDELLKLMERYGALYGKTHQRLAFLPCIDGYVLPEGYDRTLEMGLHHDIPYLIGSTERDITVTEEMLASGQKSILYQGAINWSLNEERLGRHPAWLYYFQRNLPGDHAGAFHSSELWYMFGTLARCWRPMTGEDEELSRQMVTYWCNFIKNGDPNGEGLPEWKPYSGKEQNIRIFGENQAV